MVRILITLLLVMVTLSSCSTYTPPVVLSVDNLKITTNDVIAIVNIPFNKQLEANVKDVKWTVDTLPKGLILDSGVIRGTPSKLGEVVNVEITVMKGTQTISKIIQFKIIDDVWVNSPEVTIRNFHPDATAEYTIEVHNGESLETEQKVVTTEMIDVPDSDGLISVAMPLNQKLAGTFNEITVESSISEILYVTEYDESTNSIKVNGFLPLMTRTITIKYPSVAWFGVEVSDEKWTPLNSMVTMTPNHFSVQPHSTENVLISLTMPKDFVPTSQLYEFYIIVYKSSPVQMAGISAVLRYKSLWHVNMK
jgi:hypothetical protein